MISASRGVTSAPARHRQVAARDAGRTGPHVADRAGVRAERRAPPVELTDQFGMNR